MTSAPESAVFKLFSMHPLFTNVHTATARLPRYCALALLGATAIFILLVFNNYGISNDEEVQHIYGQLLLRYYQSGLTDLSAFSYKNLYLYGGLFDLIAASLQHGFPDYNLWDLRHLLSAGFGLLGLTGVWLLTRRLAGEWAALLALLLLLVTGAWTGAIFTHTKDVPFATAMLWSLYFMVRLLPDLPAPRRGDVIGLGLALGCAFGLRVGGVLAIFYLCVCVCLAAWIGGHDWRTRSTFLLHSLIRCIPAGIIALLLTALFWPWVIRAPENLFVAITTFSKFSFEINTIFDGEIMRNGAVPGTYLSGYLLVRLPELFLFAIVLAILSGIRILPALSSSSTARLNALPWSPVVLAASFPLAYTLLTSPPLYNGIRHFTFILPPLAILGGAGLVSTWDSMKKLPYSRLAGLIGCLTLLAMHTATLIRLHPYEYVFYNSLTGGTPGTVERWEQDYWAATTREAAKMLNDYISEEKSDPSHHYKVAVCAEPLQAAAWLSERFSVTRDWESADFFIAPTHMNCDESLKGSPIIKISRDDAVLGVVRDRRSLTGKDRLPR